MLAAKSNSLESSRIATSFLSWFWKQHFLLVLIFSLDLGTPPPNPCVNKKLLEAASSSFRMTLTLWTPGWKDHIHGDTLELPGPCVTYSGTCGSLGLSCLELEHLGYVYSCLLSNTEHFSHYFFKYSFSIREDH